MKDKIYIKSAAEIAVIRQGGQILAGILERLGREVRPGANTAALEEMADRAIRESGGRPAFKNYPMGGGLRFPSVLCISINDEVVHGSALPGRMIAEGDIVDIDIGMEWPVTPELRAEIGAPLNIHSQNGGFFTDMCATFAAGKISPEAERLLRVTEECLRRGIAQAKAGNTVNDIGRAVQELAEENGFGVVRDLVGHGVGYQAHEAPDVYNYEADEDYEENPVLREGMVIAIEPMINAGSYRVKSAKNGYTILTADGSLCAHFEHTVAVRKDGGEILTAL